MAAATALVATTGVASAATFDFAYIATKYRNLTGNEGDYDQIAASAVGAYFTDGGVSVIDAIGTNTNVEEGVHSFFDSTTSLPAGLGVCSSGYQDDGVSECSTGSGSNTGDDNITSVYGGDEAVEVVFDTKVALTDLTFRTTKHGLAEGTLLINGVEYSVAAGKLTDAGALGAGGSIGVMESFTFGYGGSEATPIYLQIAEVAAIPLPATFGFLAMGLAGLGVARRRKS